MLLYHQTVAQWVSGKLIINVICFHFPPKDFVSIALCEYEEHVVYGGHVGVIGVLGISS